MRVISLLHLAAKSINRYTLLCRLLQNVSTELSLLYGVNRKWWVGTWIKKNMRISKTSQMETSIECKTSEFQTKTFHCRQWGCRTYGRPIMDNPNPKQISGLTNVRMTMMVIRMVVVMMIIVITLLLLMIIITLLIIIIVFRLYSLLLNVDNALFRDYQF